LTETDWRKCDDLEAMLSFLQHQASDRRLRLFACACCRALWPVLADERARRAVDVLERYADGRASEADLQAARVDAEAARAHARAVISSQEAVDVFGTMPTAERWVRSRLAQLEMEAANVVLLAAWPAQQRPPWWQAAEVATTAEWVFEAGIANARDLKGDPAAPAPLADLLRDVFNPFRSVLDVDPACLAWQGGTVRRLARTIYEERAFDRLPILADALEEAGCEAADLLAHCRSGGEHVRGCWAIDLLLGQP
jgi:hypothetical protein